METLTDTIIKYIGPPGRMIGASKSGYRREHPDSRVYFNACIFDKNAKQVWWGDIDLTLDDTKLGQIAEWCAEKFYVTPEHPFRSDFNKVTLKELNTKDDMVGVIQYN